MKVNIKKMISADNIGNGRSMIGRYHRIRQEQIELFHLINNRGHLFFRSKAAI